MWVTFFVVDVPIWIYLLILIAVLLYWYGTQAFRIWKDLGVNGPAPYPFVGNMIELFDDRVGVRTSINKWQKQYGRIFGVYFFRKPTLVVTDPEALRQIFVKDFNNFTDRFFVGSGDLQQRVIKKGLFFEDGANWKRMRRIISPTFSGAKLRLLTHYMNLTAQRLAENLRENAAHGTLVEAKKTFGAFTLDVICGTAFGLDTNSQQNFEGPFIQHAKSMLTFKKSLQLIFGLTGAFPIMGPIFKKMGVGFFKNADVRFFEKAIFFLILQRKALPEKQNNMDFLQLLMEAEADDSDEFVGEKKLTTEEIVAQCIVFIIAGYETTSTALQYLSFELAKNQEVQAKVIQEINEVLGENEEPDYDKCQKLKYTEATISEILRMYPPVHLLTRLSEHTFNLKGITIPANSAILLPLSNIGRDPEFFPDPDTLRPERFLNENRHEINPVTFLPFGFGPRSCVGMRLAMMEMKIALVHIFRNIRIATVTPEVLDIEDYTGILVPRIPIRFQVQAIK